MYLQNIRKLMRTRMQAAKVSAPGGKPKSQSLLIGSPGPPTVVVGNSGESALFIGSEIRRQQG